MKVISHQSSNDCAIGKHDFCEWDFSYYHNDLERTCNICKKLEMKKRREVFTLNELSPDLKKLTEVFHKKVEDKLTKAQNKYGYTDECLQGDWQEVCMSQFKRHIEKGDP